MFCVPCLSAELLISKNRCPAHLRGLRSLAAIPSLPLPAVLTLGGRKCRISRSTNGQLLFHCYCCVEPCTPQRRYLSPAAKLTLPFPDRQLHVYNLC